MELALHAALEALAEELALPVPPNPFMEDRISYASCVAIEQLAVFGSGHAHQHMQPARASQRSERGHFLEYRVGIGVRNSMVEISCEYLTSACAC